ncbi:hypothetical protein F8S13_18285 [Chloroflexia bacterium SDU3-3]|nr:hypothetical protein F8S13_18285 [Chloroflexia bacterium SDU3-3]
MRSQSKPIILLAIALILVTGLIHFVDAPDSFEEATYKGMLFLANGIGALVAVVGLWRGERWGWWLGTVVAGGAFVGYVASRTVGLPGIPAEPNAWLEPLGVLSLVAEAGFVALAAWAMQGVKSAPAAGLRPS